MKSKKTYECPYCGKKFLSMGTGSHLKNHRGLKHWNEMKFDVIKFNNQEFFQNCNSSKDFEKIYDENSLPMFSKKWPNLGSVQFLCEWYGVKMRSSSESIRKFTIPKNTQYYEKNYGTTNALSKGSPGFIKRNDTVKKRYGVDNIFQYQKVKEWIHSDELYMTKYGKTQRDIESESAKKWIGSLTEEEKNKWLDNSIRSEKSLLTKKHHGIFESKLEKRIAKLCIDIGLDIETQFYIKLSKSRALCDIRIKNTNVIFEIFGSVYHADPRIYKSSDIMFFGKSAQQIWDKDKKRLEEIESKGYKVEIIWEEEFKLSDIQMYDLIKEKIRHGTVKNSINQKD